MYSPFYRQILIIVLVAALALALFKILAPFWGALAWAAFLAFLFAPLHRRLTLKLKGRPGAAAGILVALTPLFVLGPLTVLGIVFVDQVRTLVAHLQQNAFRPDLSLLRDLERYPWLARAVAWLRDNVAITADQVREWLVANAQSILKTAAAASGNVVLGTIGTLLGFFLMLFLLFFLLRDGREMFARAARLLPLERSRRVALIEHLASVTRAVVYGTCATAALQGVLIGIGFSLAGLASPVVFGALAAVLALLPAGGTAFVWIPAALWLLATQRWGAALFILVWGFAVSVTDNLLRPMLISKTAPVSTLAVFVGVVGGVSAFGAIGLIAGPVLLTLIGALFTFAEESRGGGD